MQNPIEALMNNDPNAFKESISNMLMAKIGDRIELERVSVASQLFNTQPEGDSADV